MAYQNQGNGRERTNGRSQGKSFGRRDDVKSFGKRDDKKEFGKRDDSRNFGKRDGSRSFGKRDDSRSFGKRDDKKEFGKRDDSRRFDRPAGKVKPYEHEEAPEIIEKQQPEIEEDEAAGDQEGIMQVEGRNAILEAFRSGKTVDRLYLQDGLQDGPMMTLRREAKKHDCMIKFVEKERLDQMSSTGKHQGAIATMAAYEYAELEDLFANAEKKGEAPFFILLDDIEDPHNLGAIIRTANLAGAHGVIIPKNRAVGLTATVARTSAGALNYTPVAKVTNLSQTIAELKKRGMWFVCADMGGTPMYDLKLTGSIGLVIGNEGSGVSRLVKENCDMTAAIPMHGDIDSLNASVAAGVLAYEIVRQRLQAKP